MNKLYTYKFKVARVIDGDTVYGIVDLGFNVSMYIKVRLYRINAPEMRGEEREKGIESRHALVGRLIHPGTPTGIPDNGKMWRDDIFIETIKDKKGKYGRWLGILWIKGVDRSVNGWLVENGFAVEKFY